MSTILNIPLIRKASLMVAISAAVMLAGCEKKAPVTRAPPAVTVANVLTQEIRNYELFDGSVSAVLDVNLEARVPGYLTKISFADGAYVKKGQLLFIIEQDQYAQQVKLNQAIFEEAKIEINRQKSLLKENATSQASVDKATSAFLQAEANLKLAKINYGYTEVRAPFDGLMGRHLIDEGNYLGSSPQGVKLAVIQKINPIWVYFSINERDLLKYQKAYVTDDNRKAMVNTLPVYVALQGETGFPHQGTLDFAANLLSTSTGSLQLRAELKNDQLNLIPGLYAKVMLQYGDARQGLLIPTSSLMADQQGSFVYTMSAEKKVMRRNVKLGQKYGPLTEIRSGLAAADVVIINGFINVSEGQVVDPKTVTIDPLPKK